MAGRKATKAVEASKAEVMESGTEEIKAEEAAGSKGKEKKKTESKKTAAGKADAAAAETKTGTTRGASSRSAAKETEVQCSLHVQYAGRSYSEEELVKIAKDVWKYDLKREAEELNSVSLYVKPEENKVYYVMNDEFTGCFDI